MSPFAWVDVVALARWISDIHFDNWPQQNKPGQELKPAMVTNLGWHGFGERTNAVVARLMTHFPDCSDHQRMLSVVMPGNDISEHRDEQGPEFVTRVHVPLTTNRRALFITDGDETVMWPGGAYRVDTRRPHRVVNCGTTPRIHFMFDVRRNG